MPAMPIGGNEAEWLTRKRRIDTKLCALNPAWQIVPWRETLDCSQLTRHAITEYPSYAEGVIQGSGNWNGYRVPLLYATNGEIIWHLDVRPEKPVSRTIANFHTSAALPEQQEVVRQVEGLFTLADQLGKRLAKARGQVEKLTPSLLARAFASQLVPQDPTDEPA